ncbi:hypothetical protein BBK36DRAFT_1167105 [Trichoderma citrinoviride]|uniref:Uncharacterized protein n=1 Tax=Trichoderma citrinoviride TaxID=58853 RepID=A0A2T4BEX7_9HYPO|nr:hypothetical protein BBK36DRAFT_1167105 [Trichoderma citrinoviride]PTB67801.1 hypothetical protein BBK36DRAFT_1167105 [Trichoderma citrinoviride]
MSSNESDGEGGQYQGSQAFTHIIPGREESINPNTGTLNFSKPLLQLRGPISSADFHLVLSYQPGSAGAFGLPRNWSFDLPYVVPESSVTFAGRTYAIDYNWSDLDGHRSGLKYMNNHGVVFEPIVPPQPLPTGQPGEYAYKLKLQDGSMDYFDAFGRPVARQDLFGNSLHYVYLDGQTGGAVTSDPCLDYILDSWGQKVTFEYLPGLEMLIKGPATQLTRLRFTKAGVDLVTDSMGFDTRFTYTSVPDVPSVLEEISYPTGMASKFVYSALDYLDGGNNVRHLPAVSHHYQMNAQGETLKHTNYQYGPSDGLTFTGISIGCQLSGLTDDLMDQGDANYQYDVLITQLDGSGKTLAATMNQFNYLHLPVAELKYLINDQGGLAAAYRTTYIYEIDPDKHARTTNHAQPTELECFHSVGDSSNESWKSMKKSVMSYNAFGELVSLEEDIYNSDSAQYVATRTVAREYYTSREIRLQRIKREIETDLVTGVTWETNNTLSNDEKTVKSSTVFFKASSEDAMKPWKTTTKQYDSKGRVTKEMSAWAEGAISPEGSASCYESSAQYSFNNGLLTVKTCDSMGLTTLQYDMKLNGGPMVKKTLPRGQTASYQYDTLGRLVKHTDALGGVTTKSYTVGNSSMTETCCDSKGYITQTTFDPLGRPVEIADNGDPTKQQPDSPSRVLKKDSYDGLGNVVCTKDVIGLATNFVFDALGRVVQQTDAAGNVQATTHDDKALTITQTLNGDVRKEVVLDNYGRTISQTVSADSGSDMPYRLVQETVYNGKGQTIKETISERATGSSGEIKILKTILHAYDADGRKASETVTGTGGTGEDVVTRQFVYDLLGNQHTWFKEVKYADGRSFSQKGPITIYNVHGNITLLRNQLGLEEKNEYNENGWLTKTTRFDGSALTFEHDACGQTVRTTSASGTTQIKYRDAVVEYEFYLDDSPRTVDYGGGRVQRYERDWTSRVSAEVDVFGTRTDISYDNLGRKASVSSQGDVVTYQYGTSNHCLGALVGYTLSGKMQYTTRISYDGFQQKSKVLTVAPDSTVLLETTYEMSSRGTVSRIQSASAHRPELNKSHSWTYDGLGQMVEEKSSDGQTEDVQTYVYDGNHNIVSLTVNGHTSNMTYNAIDQRTDSGFEYDPNGRLVRDDAGRKYMFDDVDHLLAVEAAGGGDSKFVYHGDDSLAGIARPQGKTALFYTGNHEINAISHEAAGQAEDKSSILRSNGAVLAAYSASGQALPTYLFEQHGSTAMQLTGEESIAITYDAYGAHSSTCPLEPQTSFAFGQELVDSLSGVVYLRSRFYQPDIKAFLSMDSHLVENRYAYCQGDPVNFFDPTGHFSLRRMLTAVVGAAAAVGITFATLGSALPGVVTAGAVVIGASEATAAVASSVVTGMAASAAGNVAGSLVTTTLNSAAGDEWGYTGSGLLQDVLSGALGAATAPFVGIAGARIGASLTNAGYRTGWASGATIATSIVVDFGVQRTVASAFGQPFFEEQTLTYAVTAVLIGVAVGRVGQRLNDNRRVQAIEAEGATRAQAAELVKMQNRCEFIKPPVDSSAAWSEITRYCKDGIKNYFKRGPGPDPHGGGDVGIPLLTFDRKRNAYRV